MSRLYPQGSHPIPKCSAIRFGTFEAGRALTEFRINAACVGYIMILNRALVHARTSGPRWVRCRSDDDFGRGGRYRIRFLDMREDNTIHHRLG